MIYTHVLNRSGRAVQSPADQLVRSDAPERQEAIWTSYPPSRNTSRPCRKSLPHGANVAASFARRASDMKRLPLALVTPFRSRIVVRWQRRNHRRKILRMATTSCDVEWIHHMLTRHPARRPYRSALEATFPRTRGVTAQKIAERAWELSHRMRSELEDRERHA